VRRLGATIAILLSALGGTALPSTASADTPPSTCQATLKMPSRVVITNFEIVRVPVELVSDCPRPNITVRFDMPGYASGYQYLVFNQSGYGFTPDSKAVQYPEPGDWVAKMDPASYGNLVNGEYFMTPTWTVSKTRVQFASWNYVASSRHGSAVYINGLIKRLAGAPAPRWDQGKTVYLQRYRNGHWQNLLARTTDMHGAIAVGFIQPKVEQYRLLTLDSYATWGTVSASTFR
jgi:hypothetical protein